MERAGARLKRVREKLGLTYRHVEKASQEIAARRQNDEYAIALSRLADIENKGTMPTIFRLYSLCAIYRLDFNETLRWYGVEVEALASEAVQVRLPNTHPLHFDSTGPFLLPESAEKEIDFTKTTFLGQFLRRWGRNGLAFLSDPSVRQFRYGIIGLEDWSMYPILHPGSLVLIDETRRRVAAAGWMSELDRPVYFIEHRDGYRCAWCSLHGDTLLVHSHPSSQVHTEILAAGEFDIIGQVSGVAMRFESPLRRPPRNGSSSAETPGLQK
jgi:transcriptional regulator with XRE-family HTH domain